MKTGCRYFNKVGMLVLCLVLGGCEATAVKDQAPAKKDIGSVSAKNSAASIETPLVSANDSLLAMLRYSRFINGLSKYQVGQEFKRINDAYFIRPNDRSGLKRAMLLMVPGTDIYDLHLARQSFNEIISSNDNAVPAFKEYAEFMLSILDAQEQAGIRYNQLQEQLNQEISKREQLEEKLEALKSIEENMIQRRSQ